MSRIAEYKVLSTFYASSNTDGQHDRLSKQVNDHIEAGWQPFGALSLAVAGDVVVVTQPIVRYEP